MKHALRVEAERGASRSAFWASLVISGLSCAADGAPLERALAAVPGVRSATVNPLSERVHAEVDSPAVVGRLLKTIESCGYRVDSGELSVNGDVGKRVRIRPIEPDGSLPPR